MNASVPETQQRRPNRRWLQFSLRSLLLFVLIFSIACSWFGMRLRKAEKQRDAVAAFKKLGGFVRYDFDPKPNNSSDPFNRTRPVTMESPHPPYPAWLVEKLGVDFFANVTEAVYFPWELTQSSCFGPQPTPPPNLDFGILARFPSLQTLTVVIRDRGDFEKIARLTQIEHLDMVAFGYSDQGLSHFQAMTRLRSARLCGIEIPFRPSALCSVAAID